VSQKVVPEIVFDMTAHPDQNLPHPEAKETFQEGYAQDQGGIQGKIFPHDSGLQIVDDVLQDPGRKHAGDDRQENHQESYYESGAVSGQVRQKGCKRVFHGTANLTRVSYFFIRPGGRHSFPLSIPIEGRMDNPG
jgi:hypothetical protein